MSLVVDKITRCHVYLLTSKYLGCITITQELIGFGINIRELETDRNNSISKMMCEEFSDINHA